MKIVLATDTSDPAKQAAEFLKRFKLSTAADVIVAHVVGDRDVPARVGMHPGWSRVVASLVDDATTETEQAAQALEGWANTVTPVVEKGHAADTIASIAEDHQADLIVVGAIGHSAIRRIMLGSVSDHVATHAKSPTLVVRPSGAQGDEKLKLLFAYDGSPKAEQALTDVVTLFKPDSIEVTLLAVIQEFGSMAAEYVEAAAEAWQEARDQMKAAIDAKAAELKTAGIEANTVLAAADHVGDSICNHGKDADIVIVGDQGHDAVERFILGSVSRYVLRHCDRSVWINR